MDRATHTDMSAVARKCKLPLGLNLKVSLLKRMQPWLMLLSAVGKDESSVLSTARNIHRFLSSGTKTRLR